MPVNPARDIADKFGSQAKLALALDTGQDTVLTR